MSDILSAAVLSLFQVRTHTASQCPPGNTGNFNDPFFGGSQRNRVGAGGSNCFNMNYGGKQINNAGRGRSGASGSAAGG